MPTTTHDIVAKLWNLCNVLKDDGVTYHQYVSELTYLLFLKMAKETGTEAGIPEEWCWDELEKLTGLKQLEQLVALAVAQLYGLSSRRLHLRRSLRLRRPPGHRRPPLTR